MDILSERCVIGMYFFIGIYFSVILNFRLGITPFQSSC